MKPNVQVLLVDSHAGDVKVVRETLGSAGLEIHVRTSASAALVAFHALEPDLVLVDSDVPGTSGAAVTREIKNTDRGRSTPVILMANGPIAEAKRTETLSSSGCTMLLQKPLLPQDLLDALSRFLPGAFIVAKQTQSPPPKSTAIRRAAGGMRDPGTPFTADSFDEDSLGALLDQVFPTSDSGTLSRSIRRRAKAEAGPESEIAAREGLEPPEDAKVAPPAASPPMSETSDFDRALATPASPTPTADTPAKPQGDGSAAEPSTTEMIEAYLASGPSIQGESPTTGLTTEDDDEVDRAFGSSWDEPVGSAKKPIPPSGSDAASPTPSSKEASASTEAPGANKLSFPLATPPSPDSMASLFDEPIKGDAPGSGGAVWEELEAALPPAPSAPSKAARPDASAMPPTETPLRTASPAPKVSAPATDKGPRPSPSTPSAAPATAPPLAAAPAVASPGTSSPAPSPAPTSTSASTPAPMTSVPVSPVPSSTYAKGGDTVTAPSTTTPKPSTPQATPVPPPPQASRSKEPPQPETIPLATESAGSRAAPERSSESKRGKKHKKGKGRREDTPKSIPLATDGSRASQGAMQPVSVAEGLASDLREMPVARAMRAETSEALPEMAATVKPRRAGAVALVVTGLALAAAVGGFFIMNRSADSDLRPATPGRARTPGSPSLWKDPEPDAGVTDDREALSPLIPTTGGDATSATSAPPPPSSAAPAPDASTSPTPKSAEPEPRSSAQTPPGATSTPGPAGPPPSERAREDRRDVQPPTSTSPKPAAASRTKPDPAQATSPSEPAPARRRTASPEGSTAPGGGSGAGSTASAAAPNPGTMDPPPEPPSSEPAADATVEGSSDEPLASPVPLSRSAPVYPASALAMRTTGSVGLLVKVEADGTVSDVKVVRPAAPVLNAAAVAAARRWTYKPAHRGTESVATWIEENVVFRLR